MNSQVSVYSNNPSGSSLAKGKCKSMRWKYYNNIPGKNKLFRSRLIRYIKTDNFNKIREFSEKEKNKKKCTNLDYLMQLTNTNSGIAEMIEVYLEETPQLINSMKKGIDNNDWELLRIAAHSIKPSLIMVGINEEFQNIVKKIQEYATRLLKRNSNDDYCINVGMKGTSFGIKEIAIKLHELFLKIESVCTQACEELKIELQALKMI